MNYANIKVIAVIHLLGLQNICNTGRSSIPRAPFYSYRQYTTMIGLVHVYIELTTQTKELHLLQSH